MKSADRHRQAMEECDVADYRARKGDLRGQASFLHMAVHSEERAAWFALQDSLSKAVLYRSAATMARQLSECLANLGLAGNPDAQLKRELNKLAKCIK